MKIDDDGYIETEIGNATLKLDLYGTFNRIVGIQNEHLDPETRLPALQDLVEQLGFPRVSQRAAVKFSDGILAAVGDLEKKDGSAGSAPPTANCPSSTDSPSSI